MNHLALSDLLDNVNNRRQRLEQRLHDEMSRLLQGHMEKLAEATDRVGRRTLLVGFLALFIAIVAAIFAYLLDKHAKNLDKNVESVKKL